MSGNEGGLYRKRPADVTAYRWHRNGDHPLDSSPTCCELAGTPHEGHLVRYFRNPDFPGREKCGECGAEFILHGWIDTPEGGHRVCPGDWIITGVRGEHYPCKPDIFAATYDAVLPCEQPFGRNELQVLRSRADALARYPTTANPRWKRAYLDLADVADRLDAMTARLAFPPGPDLGEVCGSGPVPA